MANKFDAVIAAPHTVLSEARTRAHQSYWGPNIVNRWIGQLSGA
jgi:hypothetical protein